MNHSSEWPRDCGINYSLSERYSTDVLVWADYRLFFTPHLTVVPAVTPPRRRDAFLALAVPVVDGEDLVPVFRPTPELGGAAGGGAGRGRAQPAGGDQQ